MSEAAKEDLQFERAEFSGGAEPTACTTCRATIRDAYYEVDGQVTCDRCRRRAEFARTTGSAPARFAKAAVFGTAAAALGAALYYGVRALTGYEFGLIAIVVGLMVGGAVKAGSGKRGGIPYQLLAVALTYVSIVSTYIPPLLEEYAKTNPGEAPGVVAVIVVVVLSFVAPFLMGLENVIGIVIIGIGLFEAWKINRKTTLAISGPFQIGAAEAPAAAAP